MPGLTVHTYVDRLVFGRSYWPVHREMDRPFTRALKSTEYLKKVPLAFIVHLLDRISLWAQINLENVKVQP